MGDLGLYSDPNDFCKSCTEFDHSELSGYECTCTVHWSHCRVWMGCGVQQIKQTCNLTCASIPWVCFGSYNLMRPYIYGFEHLSIYTIWWEINILSIADWWTEVIAWLLKCFVDLYLYTIRYSSHARVCMCVCVCVYVCACMHACICMCVCCLNEFVLSVCVHNMYMCITCIYLSLIHISEPTRPP